VSERYPAFCRRLGLLNRWNRNAGSSRVKDDDDAPGLDEDGRAKSEDEVGRGARDEALGIVTDIATATSVLDEIEQDGGTWWWSR